MFFKGEFASDNTCQELNQLMKKINDQNVANLVELKDKNTVCCLNALIKYLDVSKDHSKTNSHIFGLEINEFLKFQLLGDSNNDNKFKVKLYNLNSYLKLDSGAFKSLNLLPAYRAEQMSGSTNKTHSVYGVLNKCCTVQGQRLLTQWIKQPLIDIIKIGSYLFLIKNFIHKFFFILLYFIRGTTKYS